MSGIHNDRTMRTVSDMDDIPQQGVQTGDRNLSTSTTGTSLDGIIIDDARLLALSGGQNRQRSPIRSGTEEKPFAPIIEGDDINEPLPLISEGQLRTEGDQHKSSKQSLKAQESSDEDSFEEKRDQYQQHKTVNVDQKEILKDLKNIVATDNRKSFQSKKHVSPDIKGTQIELQKRSSSKEEVIKAIQKRESEDEDFNSIRKFFQQQRPNSLEPGENDIMIEMVEMGSNAVPTTNPIYIYTQLLAILATSMVALVVGFASYYPSSALVTMTDRNITSFNFTEQEASWVGQLMPLASLAGDIAGVTLIEYLGRKGCILATAVPLTASWLLIACAVNVEMILAGLFLIGLCIGIISPSLSAYFGETIQPEIRAKLGVLPTVFGNVGMLICLFAAKYMNWSMLAYFGSALPVPFLCLMFLIPETPLWYVSKNLEESARKALVCLRGKGVDVEPELRGLFAADAERQAKANASMDLLKWNNLIPLSISLGLMFFHKVTDLNIVVFYVNNSN